MRSCTAVLTTVPQLRLSHSRALHPRACGFSKTFLRWPSDNQVIDILTDRCCQLTLSSYLLSQVNPRMTSSLSSRSSTMNSSSYYLFSNVHWIPTTRFFTLIDAPVARCTVILVGGISRSTKLKLPDSNEWRRAKLFDSPQATWALSGNSFVTSNVRVMRDTSSPG